MFCPKCNQPMMKMVMILVWCPADTKVITKTTLRSKKLEISAVKEPSAMNFVCERCGTLGRILKEMDNKNE